MWITSLAETSTTTPRYYKMHYPLKAIHTTTYWVIQQTEEPEPISDSVPEFYCISINGQEYEACPVIGHHIKDTVVSAEEGELPRCPKCGIFQWNIGPAHQESQRRNGTNVKMKGKWIGGTR
jgi:hypothetical protein